MYAAGSAELLFEKALLVDFVAYLKHVASFQNEIDPSVLKALSLKKGTSFETVRGAKTGHYASVLRKLILFCSRMSNTFGESFANLLNVLQAYESTYYKSKEVSIVAGCFPARSYTNPMELLHQTLKSMLLQYLEQWEPTRNFIARMFVSCASAKGY